MNVHTFICYSISCFSTICVLFYLHTSSSLAALDNIPGLCAVPLPVAVQHACTLIPGHNKCNKIPNDLKVANHIYRVTVLTVCSNYLHQYSVWLYLLIMYLLLHKGYVFMQLYSGRNTTSTL